MCVITALKDFPCELLCSFTFEFQRRRGPNTLHAKKLHGPLVGLRILETIPTISQPADQMNCLVADVPSKSTFPA